MSRSGLPGSRVAASRAGIRTMVSDICRAALFLVPTRALLGINNRADRVHAGVIRVASMAANRYPNAAPAPLFIEPHAMNSFELNKILGAILGTCLITLALNIGAGA